MSPNPKIILDFDGWRSELPESQRSIIDEEIRRAPDKEAISRQLQNTYWIAQNYGLKLGTVHSQYKKLLGGYAVRAGWGPILDTGAFNAKAREAALAMDNENKLVKGMEGDNEEAAKARESSLVAKAYWAATNQLPVAPPELPASALYFQDWQREAKAHPGYSAKNAERYWRTWDQAYSAGQRDVEAASAVAKDILGQMGDGTEADTSVDAFKSIIPRLRELSPQQRALTYQQLAKQAKDSGLTEGMGLGSKALVAMQRAIGDTASNIVNTTANIPEGTYKAGGTVAPMLYNRVLAEMGGQPIEFNKDLEGTIPGGIAPGLAGAMDVLASSPPLTQEMADYLNAQIKAQNDDVEILERLREVATGKLSPIKKDGIMDFAVLGAAESIPLMATVALNPAVSYLSYTGSAERDLREKGIDRASAKSLAPTIGVAQMALDRVQLGFLKKMPGLDGILQKWSTSAAASFAGRVLGTTLAETGVELTQDVLAPAFVQEVGSWLDDNIPGVNAGKVWEDVVKAAPETFLSMLLLPILGAGRATWRDIQDARTVMNPDALAAYGLTEEEIQTVGVAVAKGTKEGVAAFRDVWQNRGLGPVSSAPLPAESPSSAVAPNVGGPGGSAPATEESSPTEPTEDPPSLIEAEPEVPTSLRRDDDGWKVVFEDGKEIRAGSIDAALHMQASLRRATSEKEAAAMVALADEIAGRSPNTEQTFSGDVVKVDEGKVSRIKLDGTTEAMTFGAATARNLDAQLQFLGSQSGIIQGSNMIRRDGVRLLVNNQSRDGMFTQAHEFAESNFREIMARDGGAMAVAAAKIAVGTGLFDNSPLKPKDRRTAEDVQFAQALHNIAAGMSSETEARETFSELAVADFLGRRKDGRYFTPGIIKDGVAEMLKGNLPAAMRKTLTGFMAMLKAVRAYVQGVFSIAAKLQRARREGTVVEGDALTKLLDEMLGVPEQRRHNEAVLEEVGASDWVDPDSLSYNPAEGEAFSVNSRAQVAEKADGYAETALPGATMAGPATFSIRAYHATPHKVDKFRTARIGTGEGAQAFGWGLYFAESEAVSGRGGAYDLQFQRATGNQSNIYLVEILADESRMIDWDKPIGKKIAGRLAKQSLFQGFNKPGFVNSVFTAADIEGMSGRELYELIGYRLDGRRPGYGHKADVTYWLRDRKIAGIRYLDSGSRGGVGTGTYNYVIFDDKLVKILEENGKPVEQGATFSIKADRVTPAQDAEYMAAVESGDMERAQRMVDAAAKAAGYNVGPVYHGSAKQFDAFKIDSVAWFAVDKNAADGFATRRGQLVSAYLRINNPLTLPLETVKIRNTAYVAQSNGHDALIAEETGDYAVFDPNQIKSADPVTRDDSGAVIPLSMRFDSSRDEITFSLAADRAGAGGALHQLSDKFYKGGQFMPPPDSVGARKARKELAKWDAFKAPKVVSPIRAGDKYLVVVTPLIGGEWSRRAQVLAKFDSVADAMDAWAEAVSKMQERLGGQALRLDPATGEAAFSLADESALETIARRIEQATPVKPEARLASMAKAAENLKGIQRVWLFNDSQNAPFLRTQAAVERQRRAMRKARETELLDQVEADFRDLEEARELASPTNSPFLSELFRKKQGDSFPRSRIARRPKDYQGGSYDGATELPSWMFGGTETPDNLAQELYDAGLLREPSTDALWTEIEKALKQSAKFKETLKKYRERRAEAKATAREEAADWAESQNVDKDTAAEQRVEVSRSIVALDAILFAAPVELRGKVGGFAALSRLTTDKARIRFLLGRVDKMVQVYEKWLKDEYTDKLEKLIERANDTSKPGEKARGAIGPQAHRFFAAVGEVVGMTAVQVEAKQAELENELTRPRAEGEADLTDDEAANIFEKQQVLDLFGNLKDKNAAELSKAYEAAQAVYKEGRNRWRITEEARLAEVRAIGDGVIAAFGGAGYKAIQGSKANARGLRAKANSIRLELKNFGGFLKEILGENNEIAARWTSAARAAMQFTETARRALKDEWKAKIEESTGKKGRAARLEVWGMVQNQTIDVVLAGAAKTSTRSVPESVLEDIMDGTIDPRDVGLTRAQADALIGQEAGKPLEVQETSRGPSENIQLSESEGIFITMLAAQEQYEKGLDAAGFTGDAITAIEESLSPAAKTLRSWMRGKYADNYKALNAVFSRMFGVDLAQIENYAPAAFYHTGDANAKGPEDSTMQEGGFRSNFLKTRKKHRAAPRLENAFAAFFGHAAQSAHWQGFAELVREMRGVMARPDVKMAMEGRHGREVSGLTSDWLKNIEGNGISRAHGALDAFTGWLLRQAAYVHLAYNVGTLVVQSTAALGAAWKIGAGQYMRGLGKLMAGRLDVKAMWNSDLIQNRLANGYAPEVRAALNDLWSAKPSLRQDFLEKGMELIGFVDAFWTTGSAAIAYDAHYREAKAAGMSEESAKAIAMARTEETVGETAQPSTITEKSLFEAKLNNFGKLAFLYASESRQKTAMLANAWKKTFTGKATRQDIQVLILAHLVLGSALQFMRAALRDMKDDDDEEVFDKKHWQKPGDWIRSIALGPLNGIPLVGDLFSGYTSDNAAVGRFKEAGSSAISILKGPEAGTAEKGEWYWNRAVRVLKGMDAATAVGAGIADQVFKTADNFSE